MATLTIRNLDDKVKRKLQIMAAQQGHTVEEEARRILDQAVAQDEQSGLGTLLSCLFTDLETSDLVMPARSFRA